MATTAILDRIPSYSELHPEVPSLTPSSSTDRDTSPSVMSPSPDRDHTSPPSLADLTPLSSMKSETNSDHVYHDDVTRTSPAAPKPGRGQSPSSKRHSVDQGENNKAAVHVQSSVTAPGGLDLSGRSNDSKARTTKQTQAETKLEDFELIRVLGKGCAGRVLLVRHTPTSSIRAMKALSKRSVLTHDELFHTLTELSILRRFAEQEPDNPFVSSLHCSFTDRENFYFVMDFYPGGDLATQMEIWGILGHHRTRFYAADLVQGLEDLHRHGIIVRDLKPENILLNARGHAVLADFGLSKDFEYRGDPLPVHVVTYPGDREPPEWAGAGMGSARMLPDGSKRLMVDRANSFVGTSEYLSPEVVKRAEYTYAVDWWALGCIVLEGLIGRVPFRKDEDEPLIVLWNRIVSDPWDQVLLDRRIACRPLSDYGLDPVTWHFIDALLEKDPMWRLTEPFVKRHGYFQHIDWDTVKAGEYDDPHDLDLHPVHEYNTQYFPKLCLEEEPSVDMSSHDAKYVEDAKALTPLNDNSLYALECAKFRKELQAFTWSREESELRTGSDIDVDEEGVEADEMAAEPAEEGSAESDAEPQVMDTQLEEEDADQDVLSSLKDAGMDGQPPHERVTHDMEGIETETQEALIEGDVSLSTAAAHEGGMGDDTEVTDTPVAEEPMSTDLEPDTHVEEAALRENSTPVAEQVLRPSPAFDAPTASATETTMGPAPEPSPSDTPKAVSPVARPSLELNRESTSSAPQAVPIRPPKNQLRLGPLISSRPSSIMDHRLSQDLSPEFSSPGSRLSRELRLPSGLPQSGLSVSDIVSVPSPGLGSPSRIVRRHPTLASVDSSNPIAPRLSVELNGRSIPQLGDEDWEELDIPEHIESAENAPPSSFFNRVLKRRPSTVQASSLSRQIKSSASSSSNSSSPTKVRGASATWFPGTGGSAAGTKTKKALEKLKAFPKFRKASGADYDKDRSTANSPSPSRTGTRTKEAVPGTEPTSEYEKTPTRAGKPKPLIDTKLLGSSGTGYKISTEDFGNSTTTKEEGGNGPPPSRNGSPVPRSKRLIKPLNLDIKTTSTRSGIARTTDEAPMLALPMKVSPLMDSFSINQLPESESGSSTPADTVPHPKEAVGGTDDHDPALAHMEMIEPTVAEIKGMEAIEPIVERPGAPRRHTESGIGWFDKKPRLRSLSKATMGMGVVGRSKKASGSIPPSAVASATTSASDSASASDTSSTRANAGRPIPVNASTDENGDSTEILRHDDSSGRNSSSTANGTGTSTSMRRKNGRARSLFRSVSKSSGMKSSMSMMSQSQRLPSRPSTSAGAGAGAGGSGGGGGVAEWRSETALGDRAGGGIAPKLELTATPPLDIEWK